jgi:hypothetical protein
MITTKILKYLGILVASLAIWGLVIPQLVSAKSTLSVIGGGLVGLAYIAAVLYYAESKIRARKNKSTGGES